MLTSGALGRLVQLAPHRRVIQDVHPLYGFFLRTILRPTHVDHSCEVGLRRGESRAEAGEGEEADSPREWALSRPPAVWAPPAAGVGGVTGAGRQGDRGAAGPGALEKSLLERQSARPSRQLRGRLAYRLGQLAYREPFLSAAWAQGTKVRGRAQVGSRHRSVEGSQMLSRAAAARDPRPSWVGRHVKADAQWEGYPEAQGPSCW